MRPAIDDKYWLWRVVSRQRVTLCEAVLDGETSMGPRFRGGDTWQCINAPLPSHRRALAACEAVLDGETSMPPRFRGGDTW